MQKRIQQQLPGISSSSPKNGCEANSRPVSPQTLIYKARPSPPGELEHILAPRTPDALARRAATTFLGICRGFLDGQSAPPWLCAKPNRTTTPQHHRTVGQPRLRAFSKETYTSKSKHQLTLQYHDDKQVYTHARMNKRMKPIRTHDEPEC